MLSKTQVISDTTFYMTKKHSQKIQKIMSVNTFNNLKNEIICYGDCFMFNFFYFEFKDGKNENTVVIDRCNIKSSVNKNVFKLYAIAKSISKKEKLFPKVQEL